MTVLAYVEGSEATGTAPTVARIFSSPLGHAGTWVERTTLIDNTSFFDSRIGAVYGVRAFIGQNGPVPIGGFDYEPLGLIAQTSNGAASWAGAVPTHEDDFPGLLDFQSAWNVSEFIDDTLHAPGVVFAVCNYPTYNDFGFTVLSLLRSTDSGVSFTPFAPPGIDDQFGCRTGLALASGRLLLVKQNGSVIYKSDDDGDTWTAVSVPATYGVVDQLVQTPTARVVALAQRGSPSRPAIIYSDDEGDTWTGVPSPVTSQDLSALFGSNAVTWKAAAVSGTAIVAALSGTLAGAPPDAAFRPFTMSVDDGLTFSVVGSYIDIPTPDENGVCRQMTVADDGAVLAIQAGLGSTEVDDLSFRIWRGVLNDDATDIEWASVFTASVPENQIACQHSYIYNIGVVTGFVEVGQIGDCSTTFAPEPCPPSCPPAPPNLPMEGRVVAAAFTAALFLLGLGHAPAPGAVAMAAGCSRLTFANEGCGGAPLSAVAPEPEPEPEPEPGAALTTLGLMGVPRGVWEA